MIGERVLTVGREVFRKLPALVLREARAHTDMLQGARIVERLTMVPVTKEVVEQQDQVEIFRQQVDTDLYKIWPIKTLEPGEYAVMEYTEGKVNAQVWDFAYKLSGPAK